MQAIEEIISCIESKQSYVVEAGAGSGKTYALIQTLRHLIENQAEKLRNGRQKIICITYTNVAKNEIIKRIEYNELVNVFTIHEFLWQCIKQFQKQLKIQLCQLNEIRLREDILKGKASKYISNLNERIDSISAIFYNDSSFRDFERGEIHHDDVIELSKMIFDNYSLISSITAQKYPFILIDEYQDTSIETISLLLKNLVNHNKGKIVLGFYGDSHQKIYDSGIGDLEAYYYGDNPILRLIKKEENYRSSKAVVKFLNNFRSNIQQIPKRENCGSVKFVYWKNHPEKEKKEKVKDFEDSLKPIKNSFYDKLLKKLEKNGWNFNPKSKDKILVLANSRIAERAGFSGLYTIFSNRNSLTVKDNLLDRNHILIKLFCGYIDKKSSEERKIGLEHLMDYWTSKNHNEAIRFIRKNGTFLNDFKHYKKKEISTFLDDLAINRENSKISDVLESAIEKEILFSKNYYIFLERINQDITKLDQGNLERIEKDKTLYNSFLELPYREILNFWKHTQNETIFSTKHGTKGDQYRNVLTVIDDTEWKSEYNFNNFFNNTDDSEKRTLRTRNLFYVECSRAEDQLVVLMLSKIDNIALKRVTNWFGEGNVIDVEDFIKE
ncbi:UvrD-helicase domain-containing protein [Sphingobacterium sp. InxBP1]|uniref:UvrD-helicase domain-containing protein n=1 Tax=Sphingobacterium sp. InxBP1 TaxID=2870328 RepID=UPI002244E1B7|nr:UvrD-helicase domain-containing protein [Sphingobacterium sp. InxBP1]MCW8310166.1 UvrD-helicase domain-containing protein [Sphingobacterium sp. InxBP1]